jgi:NTP pyrophosphatase (non-canonical NTP hydrolase)
MTRTEHLLTCLAEECAEVGQRVTKALRFGLSEVQAGQSRTNAERIFDELVDLAAVTQMLQRAGAIPDVPNYTEAGKLIAAKIDRVERWLGYSAGCGTVEGDRLREQQPTGADS